MKHPLHNRIISLLLALVLFLGYVPIPTVTAENAAADTGAPQAGGRTYDYETLKITRDGCEIAALGLLHHEKIEISADGLPEDAQYQWQVAHPEQENVWVNIYDGTQKTIAVTLALVENVLRADGTAQLRCRAYTQDMAYLSNTLTVTLTQETAQTFALLGSGVKLAADAESTEETPEFVTVTIQYALYSNVLQDDQTFRQEYVGQAFTSYVATLKYGSDLKDTTVTCPTIVGYDAYLVEGDKETKCTEVQLDLTNITQDVTYTVNYRPAQVKYVVRYFFQNVYDDQYVEDAEFVKNSLKVDYPVQATGETGVNPDENYTKASFAGFTSLYYEPERIAADGSTVFHVFYERNYYLMEFDCDGGYGTDTIYVRYGTYVSVPDPVKSGWSFAGWDLIATDDPNNSEDLGEDADSDGRYDGDGTKNLLPSHMPCYNTAYKALWKSVETTYTVAYWVTDENGKLTFLGSRIAQAKSNDQIDGPDDITTAYFCETEEHSHTDDCMSCTEEEHTHSTACCTGVSFGTIITNNADMNAILAANGGAKDTEGVYFYFIQAYSDAYYNQYWCKMFVAGEYWNIYINGSDAINGDTLQSVVDGDCVATGTYVASDTTYTAYKYKVNTSLLSCNKAEHSHISDCYSCGITGHTHGDECRSELADYLLFKESDQDVVIEGDGSTVVNVYYTYKSLFQIRFIYAKKDGDNYHIASKTNNGSLTTAASGAEWAYQIGTDESVLPTVVDPDGSTKRKTVEIDGVTYYYISLTAPYGADIADLWPDNNVGMAGEYYWGSWAAAPGSGYRIKYGDQHANIVGPYPTMSSDMIVDGGTLLEGTDGTYLAQYMVAWWADSSMGVTTHVYHNFLEVFALPATEDASDTVEKIETNRNNEAFTINGVAYKQYNYTKADDTVYATYIENIDSNDSNYGKFYKLTDVEFTAAHNGDTRVDPVSFAGYTAINDSRNSGTDKQANSKHADFTNNVECPQHDDSIHTYCNAFVYNLNVHKLSFWNHNDSLVDGSGVTGGVPYGSSLKTYGEYLAKLDMGADFYPDGLEPGAYVFDGWYTNDAVFNEDTKVDWETLTMPDADMVLYAYWKPVVHDVYFYYDYEFYSKALAATGNDKAQYYWPQKNADGVDVTYPIRVEHGKLLGTAYSTIPEPKDGYTFVGWFYIDETGKKRFAPDTMQVKQELHLFAEWQSGIDTNYTVEYVLQSAATIDGTAYPAGEKIADDTFGHLTAGRTKTFNAKAGTELLEQFREASLFPTTNSHSVLMDEVPEDNKFTFEYVYDIEVWYRVRYVNKITGLDLADEKVESTTKAIVTEKFVPVTGYVPENYYIRKVLAADGDATEDSVSELNEIVFYYTPDEHNGVYVIEYYTSVLGATKDQLYTDGMPNYDSGYWKLEQSVVDSAALNSILTESIDQSKFNGFAYEMATVTTYATDGTPTVTKVESQSVSGEVTSNGLEIRIFYERKSYNYTIQYVEHGNTSNVICEKTYSAPFESEITHRAEDDYTKDGTEYLFYETQEKPQTQTWTIRASDTENVLIFYYAAKQTTIRYVAVCTIPGAIDFGIVSLNAESVKTADQSAGSTAIAGTGYEFKGWYSDAECTTQISTEEKLKIDTLPDVDEVTYYALFAPVTASLTIQKTAQSESTDQFIFRIQGQGKHSFIDLVVSCAGGKTVQIKDLPVGKYIITELTGWSWEYSCTGWQYQIGDADSVTGTADSTGEMAITANTNVTFKNTYTDSCWLEGETCKDNKFTGVYTP